MAKNANLHSAKSAKNDEFYTRIEDVEKEMKYYKDFFKGKKVLCNCNDGWSAFTQYFSMNFEHLGLARLTCLSYNKDGHGLKYVYEGDKNGNHIADDWEWEVTELNGHGDFRDEEGREALSECDVVVTNPPFSLFRDFIGLLMEYNKKFVVVGNGNAVTYKEIFPLIKNNQLWLGASKGIGGQMSFCVTEDYENKYTFVQNGQKMAQVNNACWFTNINHGKRNHPLDLFKKYNPKDYIVYDNYMAINVDKVTNIPMDEYIEIEIDDKYYDKWKEVYGDDVEIIEE